MAGSSLGNRLKHARLDARLRQKDVAKRLGVGAVALSKWENDVHEPRAEYLQQMAELYGVSSAQLLGKEPGVVREKPMQGYWYSLKSRALGSDLRRRYLA